MFFLRSLLLLILCFFSTAFAKEQSGLLKVTDIHKLVQEILKQHVEKKEVTQKILKDSFKTYIEQFDPYHIYLLEEEVRPYLQMSDVEVNKILQQYQQNDLTAYKNLNELIQRSILRARKFRSDLSNQLTSFTSFRAPFSIDDNTFAKNMAELKERIWSDMLEFLQQEVKKHGLAYVKKQGKQNFVLYDREKTFQENHYLCTEINGVTCSASEQENFFSLHVLKAISKSLDAHTSFLNDKEAYDMRIRLEKGFQGIGVKIGKKGEEFIIKEVLEGTPAAKSGKVQQGDKLIAIDNRPTKGELFENVMTYLHNTKVSKVELLLERNGQSFKVELNKELIPVNEGRVEYSYEKFSNGIIGKITVPSFYQGANEVNTENDVRDAIKELQKQGILRGLVIDLRQNTGGFLTQSIKVAGLFITSGIVVISKYSSGEEKFYRDVDGKVLFDGPIVLLVSRQTASAAEILTQALQDYGIALVVGDDHTYGKGTIQSQTVTGSNAAAYFKVTVGEYYTVSGKTPQLEGVKSDIVVPGPLSHMRIGEMFLEHAIPSEKIAPTFQDPLTDIPITMRAWYMHYYAPYIQHKKDQWRSMVPMLKKNSEYRISNNQNYQLFLKSIKDDLADDISLPLKRKNSGTEDLQMIEAVNIIKDMIILQSRVK